ncbi:3-oxoacyl-(acyl-carrier protein) reductase [Alteromonas macleodii]|jgi:3-oxoacyl-[acyl-carrier protein] reductase|tara:strand:- start:44 stop:754 length:711 start_codon:yes stop_codon:yes gene_type:complete
MTDTYALAGKTAIVTGGGKGLGKTLAQFLLEAGMNVAICGRTETAVMQTVEQFDALFPGKVIGQVCDVSKSADVASFVRKVKDTFGELHVLINNSGFGKETLIWETSEKAWDEVMDTNVKGTFLMCKEVVPHMINNKEGYIINIASQAALNGYANAGVYCASKFAMVGLGKALQEEVRPYGIHVHSLNPALIQSQKAETEKVDDGLIQNEDLGNMVVYLLSQPRRLKIDNIGLWGY